MTSFVRLQGKLGGKLRAVEVLGETLYVGKLSARDGLELFRQFESLAKDGEGKPADVDATLRFAVAMVSKCLVEPDTMERSFDCDEGRALLEALGTDLLRLAEVAQEANGFGEKAQEESKKN